MSKAMICLSVRWKSRDKLSAITFQIPRKCWEYNVESAAMNIVANFSATRRWNSWSMEIKLDLYIHPAHDELSVFAR